MDENNNEKGAEARRLVEEYLRVRHARVTAERLAMAEAICSFDGHFSIEDLCSLLTERKFRVSMATLYNNLQLMVEAGVATCHTFGTRVLYECALGVPPHFHCICKDCGKVIDLADARLLHHVQNTRVKGFKLDYARIYFYGLCTQCRALRTRKANKLLKK